MIKREKLKTLFPLPLAIFSLELYFGANLGYFITKLYLEKIVYKKFRFIRFPQTIFLPILPNYRIKLHHWLYGLLILIYVLIFKIPPFDTPFFIGFLSGVVYHDLVTDKEWYRLIYKKEKNGAYKTPH